MTWMSDGAIAVRHTCEPYEATTPGVTNSRPDRGAMTLRSGPMWPELPYLLGYLSVLSYCIVNFRRNSGRH